MYDDLISRQTAIHLLEEMKELDYELWIRTNGYSHLSEEQWDWLIDNFKDFPAVQPEQKAGRWIDDGERNLLTVWKCSECGFKQVGMNFHYCPICGAKMSYGKEEQA